MDLVERREFDRFVDLECMALDCNARAIAFGFCGNIKVYSIKDGSNMSVEPSFCLFNHADFLCYNDEDHNEDNFYDFHNIAIFGSIVAFNINNRVHLWNWQTKQSAFIFEYSKNPKALLFFNGVLHVQFETFSWLVTGDTQKKEMLVLPSDSAANRYFSFEPTCSLLKTSRCVNFAARIVDNMLCALEYDQKDKSITFDIIPSQF